MAESMVGIKRSHRCTEVTTANIGQDVTVMGWVQKSRNKGGIIFVDLRDRSGILQIIFEESDCGAENFAKAEIHSSLHSVYDSLCLNRLLIKHIRFFHLPIFLFSLF